MTRVSFFIDGFNLYHSLDSNPAYHRYKWLNLEKFSRCFISKREQIADIFYFTAYVTWNQPKLSKHKNYVVALKIVNIHPVFGAFRRKERVCTRCNQLSATCEEKQTDVNIAIQLFQTAMNDSWDTAMIVSGDSDLIPAIEAVKTAFPAKPVGIIIPIGRRAEELKQVADFHKKVKEKHLKTCQFEDVLRLGD